MIYSTLKTSLPLHQHHPRRSWDVCRLREIPPYAVLRDVRRDLPRPVAVSNETDIDCKFYRKRISDMEQYRNKLSEIIHQHDRIMKPKHKNSTNRGGFIAHGR